MRDPESLFKVLARNDPPSLATALREYGPEAVRQTDLAGYTLLMRVAEDRDLQPELMRILLEAGADPEQPHGGPRQSGANALSFALAACDVAKTRLLLDAGVGLHWPMNDTSALIGLAYRTNERTDEEVLPLIRLLIERGAPLDYVTRYGESVLRVLSDQGRFDLIRALLEAGADPAPLRWNAVHHAVALGSLSELAALLDSAADPEARDSWERTALLLAIQTGDRHKIELLLLHGADRTARGRCGKPAVFYAIDTGDPDVLTWLVEAGYSLLDTDEFGMSALAYASERGQSEIVRALLVAGLDPDDHADHRNALYNCTEPALARMLLDAGSHPGNLPFEMRRALVGLPPEPDIRLLEASAEEYASHAARRFGERNPERMDHPFWHAMVRSGIDAWHAGTRFGRNGIRDGEPVWCARRFGQSISFLPDGRIIQVAGEHEDSYDPDFCIYNDVFVHHPDGRLELYGYPEAVFPPTDFHTATLVGDTLYLIGSLGYYHQRSPGGPTPVFALNVDTLRIERLHTRGDSPGWIHRHRAKRVSDTRIHVFDGLVEQDTPGREHIKNTDTFELDLGTLSWRRVERLSFDPNVPG